MTVLFLLVFGVASTALALWVDVRFEGRRPAEFQRAILHIAAAWCTARLLVGPGMEALGDHILAALMLVALPATIYCLLSVVWLMRVCADALGRGGLHN
jgi:hypothetical protein